jgi:hypothetical protein
MSTMGFAALYPSYALCPPLDGSPRAPHCSRRQSAGRPLRQGPKGRRGGKSGLHGHAVPDNVRRGQPQGQCHRKQTAAARCLVQRRPAARVKWCGKSAPRRRQRRRHGKPHREQNRIGTAWSASPQGGAFQDRCPNPAVRVGCSKRRATGVPEEWPSRARHPLAPHRTRLTGRLICKGARRQPPPGPANFLSDRDMRIRRPERRGRRSVVTRCCRRRPSARCR